MEKSATDSKERIQENMRDRQQDILDSGRQDVDEVSHLDPSRGTLANTGVVLKGETVDLVNQITETARDSGFSGGDKPGRN